MEANASPVTKFRTGKFGLRNHFEEIMKITILIGFEKAWVKDDTFKLKVIDHLLDNPLELPEYVEETVEFIY